MRYWRNLKRTKRYKEHDALLKAAAKAEMEANPDGPFRDVLVTFPKGLLMAHVGYRLERNQDLRDDLVSAFTGLLNGNSPLVQPRFFS